MSMSDIWETLRAGAVYGNPWEPPAAISAAGWTSFIQTFHAVHIYMLENSSLLHGFLFSLIN